MSIRKDHLTDTVSRAVTLPRIIRAYKATFSANATQEDVDIVLDDLATFTRFYEVTDATSSPEAVRYIEGLRTVFHRIRGHLRMTDAALSAMERNAD